VRISPDWSEAALDGPLQNAVKFTRCGDRIWVTGERYAGGWAVHVRDFGAGIPAETAYRLMLEEPGRPTQTGTGLGWRSCVPWLSRWAAGSRSVARSAGTLVTLYVPQPPLDPRDSLRSDVGVAEPLR
jgi:signal transduction histidine kinase